MSSQPETTFTTFQADEIPSVDETGFLDSQLLGDFIKRKDQHAFAELVRLHGPLVYGVCRRVVGRHHDAEDAFQATFLILSQKAASITKREVLASWLYRVAFQVSLRVRAGINKRRVKEQPMTETDAPLAAEPSLWDELEPILDHELSQLSEKHRVPVLLCDLGASTQKEAATQLGWSESTLASRLMKARSLLAQRLAKHGFTLSAGALAILISQNAASAAVPVSLFASTLQTAGVSAAGQAFPMGVASSKIAAIAQGTMKSALMVNLKFAVALVALVVIGAAAVGLQRPREEPKAEIPEVKIQQVSELKEIPPEVWRALEENAARLKPISISYTVQKRSLLSKSETLARLKTPHDRSSTYRMIYQDQKHYSLDEGTSEIAHRAEYSFDGKIVYDRESREGREQRLYRGLNTLLPVNGRFLANTQFGYQPYFVDGYSGIVIFNEREPRIDAENSIESSVGSFLKQSWIQIISVADVLLDRRPHLKIECRGENWMKKQADNEDIEKMKKDEAFLNSPPDFQKNCIEQILARRQMSSTMRWVFYLDPELHYALRQKEEWLDPATLLSRCRCSDFQQLSDRQVWLPRRYETDVRNLPSVPGVLFAEPVLLEVVQVSELSGERVPDERFVLNATQSGVRVTDETETQTVTVAGKTSQKGFAYGYVTGKTPQETVRNIERAKKEVRGIFVPPSLVSILWPKSAIHWFLVVNAAVVLSIGLFLAYRRIVK